MKTPRIPTPRFKLGQTVYAVHLTGELDDWEVIESTITGIHYFAKYAHYNYSGTKTCKCFISYTIAANLEEHSTFYSGNDDDINRIGWDNGEKASLFLTLQEAWKVAVKLGKEEE